MPSRAILEPSHISRSRQTGNEGCLGSEGTYVGSPVVDHLAQDQIGEGRLSGNRSSSSAVEKDLDIREKVIRPGENFVVLRVCG